MGVCVCVCVCLKGGGTKNQQKMQGACPQEVDLPGQIFQKSVSSVAILYSKFGCDLTFTIFYLMKSQRVTVHESWDMRILSWN